MSFRTQLPVAKMLAAGLFLVSLTACQVGMGPGGAMAPAQPPAPPVTTTPAQPAPATSAAPSAAPASTTPAATTPAATTPAATTPASTAPASPAA